MAGGDSGGKWLNCAMVLFPDGFSQGPESPRWLLYVRGGRYSSHWRRIHEGGQSVNCHKPVRRLIVMAGRWVYIYCPRRGRTWLACKSLHFDLKSVLATLIIESGKLKPCFAFPRE